MWSLRIQTKNSKYQILNHCIYNYKKDRNEHAKPCILYIYIYIQAYISRTNYI